MAARKQQDGEALRSFQAAGVDVEEIEVSATDPGPDEGDDEVSATDPGPNEGDTRREKKNRRFDGRLKAAEERAQKSEEETTALRARLDAMERRDRGGEGGPNIETRYKGYMDGLVKQETDLHERYQLRERAGNLTRTEVEEFRKQAADIEERKAEARHRYYTMRHPPAQGDNDAVRILRLEYPDIVDDPKRWSYANAEYNKRIARGEPDGGLPMYRKIIEDVRVELGIKPKPVEASTKDRYTSRGTGAGSGSGDTITVKMTSASKSMAETLYPQLPREQAWKKWAETAGKRAAQARAQK